MLANWLRQRILAATTGDILLGDPVAGFIGCSNVFTNDGRVYYSVEDGLNRETGKGTYIQASNSIQRTEVFESLIEGVFTKDALSPMALSDKSVFSVTATIRGLTSHVPVWKDIVGRLQQNPNTGYLSPDTKNLAGSVEAYSYKRDLIESLGVTFAIPHDTQVGGQSFPHIRWSPNTPDTGIVRWGIEFMVADIVTGVFNDTTIIYLEQAGSSTVNKLQIIESLTPLVSPEPNSLIVGRVFRDATHVNDTFVGDGSLHAVGLHYQSNLVGTPSRTPDFDIWE